MKKLLLLLFISSQLFSQKINFKGKLLDKETNEPVVYANISFIKANNGTSSLEDGTFNLKIDKTLLNKKVHISCLNYKDTIVLAKEIHNKRLYLQPKNFELDEIIISKKVDRELLVDKYKRKDLNSGFGSNINIPWIVTKYFKYDSIYIRTPYLKNVVIHTRKNRKSKSGKFRLRIFSIDSTDNKPKDDLINNQIIFNVEKRKKIVQIDLSKYDIEIPKEGLYIGFEWLYLEENFYDVKITKKNGKKVNYNVTHISPILKGKIEKNKTTWVFSQGKWHKLKFIHNKNKTITPAISLTLSN